MLDWILGQLQTLGLNDWASIVTLLATAAAAVGVCVRWIFRIIYRWLEQKPIDRLYKALIEHSVVSKSEVIYQIRSYIPPHLSRKANDPKQSETMDQLLKQIKVSSGDKKSSATIYSIVGAPACGKTATMRYLYCQMSKSRKCVYFQMQDVTSLHRLGLYLKKQKMENHIKNDTSVVAFFDGLDEAHTFLLQENPNSMEEALRTTFFLGSDSKIDGVFQENNLNLDCVVISLRPEFLEHSVQELSEFQYKNIYSKVYKIEPMAERDILKTFRSLRMLKKLEARRKEEVQRHQDRCPPWGKMRRYTKLLKKILRENKDCIFRYPMYIRYAYAFMREYESREELGSSLSFSSNMAVSFDILLNAIFKWEFHVYHENRSAQKNQAEWEQFRKKMEQFIQAVVVYLLERHKQRLFRDELEVIVQQFFPQEVNRLAVAHCFMVSNDTGTEFVFAHKTFYEYFLARYLLYNGDYALRKKHLIPEAETNLRAMYYSILAQDKERNTKISQSTTYVTNEMLPRSYQELDQKGEMPMEAQPIWSMVEILEYLPRIRRFSYRDHDYTREYLEELMESGKLNLEKTKWDCLSYAKGIIPPERVKRLNINSLPLTDAGIIEEYSSLKYLEMLFPEETAPFLTELLGGLQKIPLKRIHIFSRDGSLCQTVYDRVGNETLHIEQVYVETPNYSNAHLKMYQLNLLWEESEQKIRFYPTTRSDLAEAKKIYNGNNAEKDPEMLKAVFELEALEGGVLGLEDTSRPEATYWNGMSLAVRYIYEDSIDEEKKADQICKRLEPYIKQDASELSVKFGYLYGKNLLFRWEHALAVRWLSNTYRNGKEYLSEENLLKCGVYLYRVRIRNKEKNMDAFVEELRAGIEKLPEYQTRWVYIFFLNINCGERLSFWSKGTSAPAGLAEALQAYQEAANEYHKQKNDYFHVFNSLYKSCVYANRCEDIEGGRQWLEKMKHSFETIDENEKDERNKQSSWIQYHEQALYHYLLTENAEQVLGLTQKLLDYPHRRGNLLLEEYRNIQTAYQNMNQKPPEIDKHILWSSLWF